MLENYVGISHHLNNTDNSIHNLVKRNLINLLYVS